MDFDEITERAMNETVENNSAIVNSLDSIEQYRIKTNSQEIHQIAKSFKQRAPGADNITKNHLIILPTNMTKRLANIINSCINLGHVPQQWKEAIMIMLPKAGKSPRHVENYRPISLLNVPSKILEKIINKKLIEFTEENDLQNNSQHGYRKNRGTNTATALIYELIASGKANNNIINIVFRDIKGAFDKVWHTGLIGKTIINNLPDYLVRFISNYLRNRKAKIRIEDYIGESFTLLSGVPQGGCLSPTLFSFFTHDIPDAEGQSYNITYADDITQIVRYEGKSQNMLKRKTEREIERVNKYEARWKIRTNMTKFKIVPIEGKRKIKIKVNNREIEYSKEAKALGLTITSSGFTKHITNRINLAKPQINNLFKVRKLSKKHKRILYIATVRSVLTYPPIPLHIWQVILNRKKCKEFRIKQHA